MSKEVKIKKLILELSGKDVELTLAQAKELQAALNELFEEKVKVVKEKEYVPYHVSYRSPRPWVPWRDTSWITWDTTLPLYNNSGGTSFKLENSSIRCSLKA
jgi:hypothetical protein